MKTRTQSKTDAGAPEAPIEGWFTEHPTTGQPAHVVTRDAYNNVARDLELAQIKRDHYQCEAQYFARQFANLIAKCKALIQSTTINGQRFSMMPSCEAFAADIDAAIAIAEDCECEIEEEPETNFMKTHTQQETAAQGQNVREYWCQNPIHRAMANKTVNALAREWADYVGGFKQAQKIYSEAYALGALEARAERDKLRKQVAELAAALTKADYQQDRLAEEREEIRQENLS